MYYQYFGVLMILIGLYLVVLGGRYFKVTIFLAAQFFVAAFIMGICFAVLFPIGTPIPFVWLTLFNGLCIGGVAGYGVQKKIRPGIFFVGFWIGGLFGASVYSVVIYYFPDNNPLVIMIVCILMSAIVVALLAIVFYDYAVIACSASIGAFCLVRGISLFVGGYPNEFLLIQQYDSGNGVTYTFFIYFGIMVLVSAVSLVS